jgi:hypothetical protein
MHEHVSIEQRLGGHRPPIIRNRQELPQPLASVSAKMTSYMTSPAEEHAYMLSAAQALAPNRA